jgi:hypothetical protein
VGEALRAMFRHLRAAVFSDRKLRRKPLLTHHTKPLL